MCFIVLKERSGREGKRDWQMKREGEKERKKERNIYKYCLGLCFMFWFLCCGVYYGVRRKCFGANRGLSSLSFLFLFLSFSLHHHPITPVHAHTPTHLSSVSRWIRTPCKETAVLSVLEEFESDPPHLLRVVWRRTISERWLISFIGSLRFVSNIRRKYVIRRWQRRKKWRSLVDVDVDVDVLRLISFRALFSSSSPFLYLSFFLYFFLSFFLSFLTSRSSYSSLLCRLIVGGKEAKWFYSSRQRKWRYQGPASGSSCICHAISHARIRCC